MSVDDFDLGASNSPLPSEYYLWYALGSCLIELDISSWPGPIIPGSILVLDLALNWMEYRRPPGPTRAAASMKLLLL